uniref:Uncharacterized protein n=2 Tax=Lepeophtheirus salmonis TaxID=72036 RepID=A0A0K2UIY5_LEPSM
MNPETFDGSICRSQEPFPEEKGSVLLQIKDENTPLISSERRLQVQYQAVEEGDGALSESGSTEDVTSPRYGSNGQFALFLYGLFSFGQSFAFVDWNPIENSLLFAFPSWSETTISWQSNIALLSSPLVQWPVWILLKKFKLSTVIKYMCMLPLCLTTSIRVIPLLVLNEPENIFTTLVYISSFTIGVVGVIFYSSLSKFSSLYFRSASTTYPTGIAMICSNIGLVFASIIGPFAVHDPIPIINGKKNIQDEIRNYLLLCKFQLKLITMIYSRTI